LPWDDGYRLSGAERAVVIGSIQQFQLGENAQGRRLLERAKAEDAEYLQALRLFIKEEQRHSELLCRLLDSGRALLAPALGTRGVSAIAWMGGSGTAHASASNGRGAGDSILHGAARCHRVAVAAIYMLPHSGGRSGASALSSVHLWAIGIAAGGTAQRRDRRAASLFLDGDYSAGMDGARASVSRGRIFVDRAVEAKP